MVFRVAGICLLHPTPTQSTASSMVKLLWAVSRSQSLPETLLHYIMILGVTVVPYLQVEGNLLNLQL